MPIRHVKKEPFGRKDAKEELGAYLSHTSKGKKESSNLTSWVSDRLIAGGCKEDMPAVPASNKRNDGGGGFGPPGIL